MKRIFYALVIMGVVLAALLGANAASASTTFSSWPVDIGQGGWTATGITNIKGDGSFDGNHTVNGTSKEADFIAHYKKWIDTGYWDTTSVIVITPGTLGDCSTLGPGWVIDPNDDTKCQIQVDDSGYVYVDRPQIPATYKCPNGYTGPDANGKCTKLMTAGYYETAPQPVTDPGGYSCPSNITWSETYKGVFYTTTFSYNKDDKDPHKCHRPSDDNTPPSSWPGAVRGDFNSANPEWLDATYTPPTYASCSTLGAGWETDPAVDHGCRLWHDPVYDTVDQIVDVPAHYGDCPSGYEVDPTDDSKCQQWVTGSHLEYANRPQTDPVYGCPAGYDPDPSNSSQCRKWIDGGTWQYQDIEFVMNTSSTGWTPLPPVVCPSCGGHIDIKLDNPDQLLDIRYSNGVCIADQAKHCIRVTGRRLELITKHPLSILVSQSDEWLTKNGIDHRVVVVNGVKLVYLDAKAFTGLDNTTTYRLDVPMEATGGNWVYYDQASGRRWRDVYGMKSVKQYILCSQTVNNWDVGPDGLVVKSDTIGAHVDWDWVAFIHDNFHESWIDSTAWMLKLYADGKEYLPGYPK